MKKINYLFGLMCLLTLPIFIACDDDDDFTYYTDMATVTEQDGQWILQTDNCGELIPDNSSILKVHEANNEGQRVIAAFNYFEKQDRSNRSIELYDIYKILTKDVYQMPANNEEKEDSIGNDPIKIKKILMSDEHINIYFVYNGDGYSGIKHFINLITVGDNPQPDANGVLQMEFRHNNEGDHPRNLQPGWVAFPLKSIPGYENGTTKKLSIKVKERSDLDTIITYDLKNKNSETEQVNNNAQEYAVNSFSNTKTK